MRYFNSFEIICNDDETQYLLYVILKIRAFL
jgi:hypothetical protein